MSLHSSSLHFIDRAGNTVGRIVLVSSQDLLFEISEDEMRETGEERVQLVEGNSYEYELAEALAGLRLRTGNIVRRSGLSTPGVFERGWIEPGTSTGLLPLVLQDESELAIGFAAVEVRSAKLTYRRDYRAMLEFVADSATDLVLDIEAPSQARMEISPGDDSGTIQQRLAFLRSILTSRDFMEALGRILSVPHAGWASREEERNIQVGLRERTGLARQIQSGTPRLPIPEEHPLYSFMRAAGASDPSLPKQVRMDRQHESVDTPENRFVKFALEDFSDFLRLVHDRLGVLKTQVGTRLQREVEALIDPLNAALRDPFFADISSLNFVPLSSPVLQRKAGYRELLRAWLRFQSAARLIWHGGDDVFGGGQRNVAALYEYWVFFQLLDVFSKRFRLQPLRDLIEPTKDGFGLKLKSGRHIVLSGSYVDHSRFLTVKFSYNRTFRGHEPTPLPSYPSGGSWTRGMRPDYTLSIWPSAFTEDEAERQELIVHVHFDAKYRADHLSDLFGAESEQDLDDEQGIRRATLSYKRADLLKMHTYRDAIRRSEAAFILYPGDVSENWIKFYEIIPGMGAFRLHPATAVEDIDRISQYLDQLLVHLSNRASRREAVSFHVFDIEGRSDMAKPMTRYGERTAVGARRMAPPLEQTVLVGTCDGPEHLAWIRSHGLFTVPLSRGEGLGTLPQSLPRADFYFSVDEMEKFLTAYGV